MFQIIEEGKAILKISGIKKISKKLPVFYNPVMKLNRDISVLLLNSVTKKDMQIALPLSGSGVRGIRFLLELKKNKIKSLHMNDHKNDFYSIIKENLSLNEIPKKEIVITNEDANMFLLKSSGFDYIDIDPFGTPNPFLENSIVRIARKGILAVTATDTSALSGTYENACRRKYWATPIRNELKHEAGIRILIRKTQLVGAQHDKALTPIFSYSRDHYFRVFFWCEKGKTKVDKVLKQHGMLGKAGPLWLGALWNRKLVRKMLKNSDAELKKFLSVIKEESEINIPGFYDIHRICEKQKIPVPKYEKIMDAVKKKGCKVSRTHFSGLGIRSDIGEKELVEIIKKL